jgi:hypothetical protein
MGDGVLDRGTNQSNAMGMLEAMRLLLSNRTNRTDSARLSDQPAGEQGGVIKNDDSYIKGSGLSRPLQTCSWSPRNKEGERDEGL